MQHLLGLLLVAEIFDNDNYIRVVAAVTVSQICDQWRALCIE